MTRKELEIRIVEIVAARDTRIQEAQARIAQLDQYIQQSTLERNRLAEVTNLETAAANGRIEELQRLASLLEIEQVAEQVNAEESK